MDSLRHVSVKQYPNTVLMKQNISQADFGLSNINYCDSVKFMVYFQREKLGLTEYISILRKSMYCD